MNDVFPMVYVLTTNRTIKTYRRVIRELKNLRLLEPNSILMDFEQASIKAFSAEFPDAIIRGCFFHLSQSVWRKVQSLGISTRYAEDAEFAIVVRFFPALAFVPPADVISVFDAVCESEYFVDNDEDLHLLADYFCEVYIGRLLTRTTRKQPMFPIAMWNMYSSVLTNLPRTNNNVEGWHNSFASLVDASHVNIFKFIDSLKRADVLTTKKVMEAPLNADRTQKKKYADVTHRLQCTVEKYNTFVDKIEYLRAIAHCFNLQV